VAAILDRRRVYALSNCRGPARRGLPQGAVWTVLIKGCLSSLDQIDRFTRPKVAGCVPDTFGHTPLYLQDMPKTAPPNAGFTAPIACLCPAGILA
jgi:hypothetical protein